MSNDNNKAELSAEDPNELGKKEIEYDSRLRIFGKEDADTFLRYWVYGFEYAQQRTASALAEKDREIERLKEIELHIPFYAGESLPALDRLKKLVEIWAWQGQKIESLEKEIERLKESNQALIDGGFTQLDKIKYLEANNKRLANDLADALDVKNGNGPTALSMLTLTPTTCYLRNSPEIAGLKLPRYKCPAFNSA